MADIYSFIIFLILILIFIIAYMSYIIYKLNRSDSEELKYFKDLSEKYFNDNMSLRKTKPLKNETLDWRPIIWEIYKYTDAELQELKDMDRALDIVLKIITHRTVLAWDKVREASCDSSLNIHDAAWRCNEAHELLFFFWKLKTQQTEEKIIKNWQKSEDA